MVDWVAHVHNIIPKTRVKSLSIESGHPYGQVYGGGPKWKTGSRLLLTILSERGYDGPFQGEERVQGRLKRLRSLNPRPSDSLLDFIRDKSLSIKLKAEWKSVPGSVWYGRDDSPRVHAK